LTRLSQAAGESLEEYLAFTHVLYWNRRKVWVQHNGISGRWRINKATHKPQFTPTSRIAAPDYYGCVKGRFVAFDAKSEQDMSWRLPKEREHQFDTLRQLAAAGAICWFAVEQRPSQVMRLLRITPDSPWPAIRFRYHSLPECLEVSWSGLFGGYDWLAAVEAWWLT